MKSISEIKSEARASLSNNIFSSQWIMILLVILVGNLIIGFAATVLPGIGALLLTGPIMSGICYVILLLTRGKTEVDITDLFVSFKTGFSQRLVLGLMMAIFTFLWSMLFIIPGIVKSYSYSMAYYISIDNPSLDWNSCINESRRMMNGYKAKLFIMDLSFIGWAIVGALCFGIGSLWVSAYMQTARAHFYEDLKNTPVVQ